MATPTQTAAAPAANRRVYGEILQGVTAEGRRLRAGVFNDNVVRAAAGLAMALGTVAFAYAYFAEVYLPLQIVTIGFVTEFLIRVTVGLQYSPMGALGRWMTSRQPPQWASAKPKRFAWTLGLIMSTAMMIMTSIGVRGTLPLAICLIFVALMWLEATLGVCLGCEIHRLMVRWGWMAKDDDYEVCSRGTCAVASPR
jgi:hypothetical protein